MFEGQVAVGQRLGLYPLGGIHEQDRPLACGQRAAHLVAEIDVPRCVDEVDHMAGVLEPDALELDGDPPLPLQVHGVEVLGAHLPRVHRPAQLQEPVRERGLAVVDVGDDAEVADSIEGGHAGGSLREGVRRA